ncbi:MAG: (2Fe-2S)-binding protein [Candidatus Omnitrophica bacterium]|nr:(2Fe-2S)-binding protein [Candidatus Omnitrophota bacterium]
MANITIDGKQYTVKDGITIIEAIDQTKGSDVPRYCYHPGLSIAGNCRVCQVEVEKMPRTVIACNTTVAEGMVIHTQSEKAKVSQKTVLEFLLANHPLDCPVCDQAGECKLQDYYMEYGTYDPKFNENKVKKTKKAVAIGPTINLDQERCVLCSRCVRFTDEITKTHEFGIFERGDHAKVDVYSELNNKYSGNVADICPVGALTDKDFRFKMRVWYLGKQKSVCPGCSRGCNISIETEKNRPYHLKKERVMRLKPVENPDVNQWWMCDDGRYAYKSIDAGRIEKVQIRKDGKLVETTWETALAAAGQMLTAAAASAGRWALITSPQHTNEELFLQKKFFKDVLKIEKTAYSWSFDHGYEDNFLIKADKNPNTAGAEEILGASGDIAQVLEAAKRGDLDGLIIFGRDLAKYGADTLAALRSKIKTILYVGVNTNATSEAADLVLPGASYAEVDGTFTNYQGRVQRIRKSIEPLQDARPIWKIVQDLAAGQGIVWKNKRSEDIFAAIAGESAAFTGLTYASLEPHGKIWSGKTCVEAAPTCVGAK